MKRMIAAFAVMGLAIAAAIYIAMAPLASPTASGTLNSLLATFDAMVDHIEASVGRSTGALIAIGVGLAISLVIALLPRRESDKARARGDEYGEFFTPDRPTATNEDPAGFDREAEQPGRPRDRAAQGWPDTDTVETPDDVLDLGEVAIAAEVAEEPEARTAPVAEPVTEPAFEPAPAPAARPAEPVAPPPPSPEPFAPAPLALVRKPRDAQRDWFSDASWFGGLPRLGETAWPRDESGRALPFLAQIDLADLARAMPHVPLPEALAETGALAFFLGDGGIVPVAPGAHDFSEPPQDLPPAFEEGGALLPQTTTRLTRWLFPYWPISLGAGQEPAPLPRDHPFYAVGVGERVETLWWHGVIHFAERLHDALEMADRPINAQRERLRAMRQELARIENDPDADPYERDDAREDIEGTEAELARIEEQRQSLPEMLAALGSFLEGRDPWTPLTREECDVMRDLLPETHDRYGDLIGEALPGSLAEIATISLRTAMSGPPEAVAAIPAEVLERINSEYRLPPESEHRLFAPTEDETTLAVIDLAWDDMLEWRWPEEGHFQLRLSRQDAAAGNWQAAQAVFVPG